MSAGVMRPLRAVALLAGLLLTATACVSGESADGSAAAGTKAAGASVTVRLDWAYYNPESLVLREKGWLGTTLSAQGAAVTWTQSLGSNKANENLRAGAIDFGSTAGTPALLARANGTELRTVDVYSRPEWSSLVVAKGSAIRSVKELKGRKVAVTKGTDPYFFLLQALESAGLDAGDVTVVNLQHADGRTALERGDVDAWAGLDPYLSQSQIDSGSRLIYRNLAFNSYGFLNVSETFEQKHPELVQTVVDGYEKARAWIIAHPEEAVRLLAKESKVSEAVARQQLTERTELDISPVPGSQQRAVLDRIAPVLVEENLVPDRKAVDGALDSLFLPGYARKADPS
ncbi:aliphatic sulfonate ABC transporter substrate-binding protein [Streptomyces sp. NPDC001493]